MHGINSSSILRPTTGISPKHKLTISLWHNLHILLNKESIVKHTRGLLRTVLDIPNLGVDTHLHLGVLGTITLALLGFRVRNRGAQVQHAAYGDWVLESAGIESDEVWSGVCEGCGAAEG